MYRVPIAGTNHRGTTYQGIVFTTPASAGGSTTYLQFEGRTDTTAYQIILEPSGEFAIWDTIVDDFIDAGCTIEEIMEFFIDMAKTRAEDNVREITDKLLAGEKPYYQFTMTYEECIDTISSRDVSR